MTEKSQKISQEDRLYVDILLEQYRLFKEESNQNSYRNNKQSQYIQIYGLFLFTIIGAIFGYLGKIDPNNISIYFRVPLLIVSAALLFYYYAQIYLSSYSFRILRQRMGQIENEINKRVKASLLEYESRIAPKFFGSASLEGRALTPNAWLQIFSLILFLSAVYLLSLLSITILPQHPGTSLFYIANLVFFATTLIWENLRLGLPNALKIGIFGSEQTELPTSTILFRLSRYLWNYIVVQILVFVFFFGQFNDPISTSIVVTLRGLLDSVASYDKTYILMGIACYTMLCALTLPTPSELPLVLIGQVSTWKIFLVCAIGKAIGSMLLLISMNLFFKFNNLQANKVARAIEGRYVRLLIGGNKSRLAYLLCQAIPFFPMRSSTIAYAAIAPTSGKSLLTVALISGIGTVCRMAVFYALVYLGILAFPSLGVSS